jgi:hypothetical protein
MVSQYGLEEVLLPLGNLGKGPLNNIFVSPNWKTAKKLMLIIQGSGAVRYNATSKVILDDSVLFYNVFILPFYSNFPDMIILFIS